MKSYTWNYSDNVLVHFSPKQALIRQLGQKDLVVKFPQPNEEHLGLYNAKITVDKLVELGYDCGGRKVLTIKAMRENVPFSAVLSELDARATTNHPKGINGYIIQIPLANDFRKVINYMELNDIKWF